MAQSSISTRKGADEYARNLELDINDTFSDGQRSLYLRKHNLQPGDVKVRVEVDHRKNITSPQRTPRFLFIHRVTSPSCTSVTWKEVARCKGIRETNQYLSAI